jgi:hypothetical protein
MRITEEEHDKARTLLIEKKVIVKTTNNRGYKLNKQFILESFLFFEELRQVPQAMALIVQSDRPLRGIDCAVLGILTEWLGFDVDSAVDRADMLHSFNLVMHLMDKLYRKYQAERES